MMSSFDKRRDKVTSKSMDSLKIPKTVVDHIQQLLAILMNCTSKSVCKEGIGDSIVFFKTNHVTECQQDVVFANFVHFAMNDVGQGQLLGRKRYLYILLSSFY